MTPDYELVIKPPPGTLSAPALPVVEPDDGTKMTVREAVARFIQMRIDEGIVKIDTDTYRHYDKQLRRSFCEAFGSMPLAAIRADHIRQWIRTLTTQRGEGGAVSPMTQRHYLKCTKTFFKRALVEGWIPRDPAAPVMAPKIEERSVNVVSPEQAFHCFQVNRDHWAIYRLALEAFGGLRYTTAGQIALGDIKKDRKAIEMPASIHKSGKRVYRAGQPPNLWEWLNEAPEKTWNVTDLRAYREAKVCLHLLCGLRREMNRYVTIEPEERRRHRELRNVWRHSFATYLLALDGAYPRCQYLMQHTTAKTTMIYEGIATQDDARLYFSITPDAVRSMTWEQFKRWVLKPDPEAGLNVTKSPAQAAVMGVRWQTPAGNFIDYRAS